MKTLLVCLLVFLSANALWAKKTELSLKECKNWNNFQTLDSVTVHFTAKGHELSFVQGFRSSRSQILLRQSDSDEEHFGNALNIIELAIDFSSKYNWKHLPTTQTAFGMRGGFQSSDKIPVEELWSSMHKIFSWADKVGLAKNIQVLVYSTP